MAQANRMLALRLFGVPQAKAQAVLKAAAAQGCPGLRLLSREEELVVCVNVRADSEAEASRICKQWNEYFWEQFGPAVFGEGDTELAKAALTGLAKKHKLFVAADEATGHLLEARIRNEQAAAAVYDFGDHSYRHPTKADRLAPPRALLDKYPDCPVQPAAGRARQALALSGADWAVSYQPAQGVQPGFVLVCGAKTVYLHALPPSAQPGMLAANWILDMLRRLALGLEMAQGVQSFAYGKPAPVLPVLQTPVPPKTETPRPRPAAAPRPAAPNGAWQKSGASVPQGSRAANLRSAGRQLFDESAQLPEPPAKKRNPASRPLACLALVLLIAAVAFGVVWLAERPAAKQMTGAGYGTADYDTAARDYLTRAQQSNSQVAAYLALPKLGGTLVYQPDAAQPSQAVGLAVQAAQGDELARFVSSGQPGQARTNQIVECPAGSIQQLSQLDEEELLRDNCGFTLYTDGSTYRYKVAAVFYWDPAETGETAFDLYGLQDLSDQQDFLNFVLGVKARSLYEMPVDLEDEDSFVTLVADSSDASGRKLAVTGRLQRQDEAGFLLGKQIVQADQPLLPLAMYEKSGEEAPSVETLNQYWMNWYATGGATSSDVQQESGMPQEDQVVEGVHPLDPNATPIPTLTPPPTEAPATPSPKPSATPKPGTTPKPGATDAPQSTPAPGDSGDSGDSGTGQPTPAPQPTQAPQPTAEPSAGTITVTMNGVRQEMDLVECLAMIARNELGANAPVEAYKAQMVAAHSWILSQGGAPSVSGREPNETIRQAAREVANQIVTYNGRVAFTPYFASAAFGTNPSEDVWGSSRPYLVAVESPYDQQYASNWQNTRVFTEQEVADRAMEKLGVDLYAYSEDPNDWFGDIVKNSSGYVTSLRLGTATITGQKLQVNVLAGFPGRDIRSAAFDIAYADGNFSITCYGYGHGCGLSQYGAWGYAANGWTYDQILAHYFPGTSLSAVG